MDHRASIDISSCNLPMRVWGAACLVQTPRPGFARWEDFRRWETGCRGGNRTRALRGMNPMRYRFSTLRRNGWSTAWVSGGQRRSNLTRRGTNGRFCICDFKHQGSRRAVNIGPKIVSRYAGDTLDSKDMLRGNLIPLRNGTSSDFTLARYLSEFCGFLKSVG